MTRIARLTMAGGAAAALAGTTAGAADPSAGLKAGNPDIKSAGPLAVGPDGILFVGDTQGAALFAIETNDRTPSAEKGAVDIKDLAGKVASRLGTDPKKV